MRGLLFDATGCEGFELSAESFYEWFEISIFKGRGSLFVAATDE